MEAGRRVKGKPQKDPMREAANRVATKSDTDVLTYRGPLWPKWEEPFTDAVRARRRRSNALLILTTQGGSADSAYRLARCLQSEYSRFTILVPGWCKSAGTLCVLGAHELVMTDCGELGPLDVQLVKKDELGESKSGLELVEAMRAVRQQAFNMWEQYMLEIKEQSEGLISFKTATDIAVKMSVGLYQPIFAQFDPALIGETFRAMRIAHRYGERLLVKGKNISPQALVGLIDTYPDHGFVIDRSEAAQLFIRVRAPNKDELALVKTLGNEFRYPPVGAGGAEHEYLNDERKKDEARGKKRGAPPRSEGSPGGDNPRGDSGAPDGGTGVSAPSQRAAHRIRLVPKAAKRR